MQGKGKLEPLHSLGTV